MKAWFASPTSWPKLEICPFLIPAPLLPSTSLHSCLLRVKIEETSGKAEVLQLFHIFMLLTHHLLDFSSPMESQRQSCLKEETGAHLLYWNITARKAMGSLTLEV